MAGKWMLDHPAEGVNIQILLHLVTRPTRTKMVLQTFLAYLTQSVHLRIADSL